MTGSYPGRVIVGVNASLGGLQALRESVREARLRQTDLLAVRAFRPPRNDYEPMMSMCAIGNLRTGYLSLPPPQARELANSRWWEIREREATDEIREAFVEAMGAVPSDVTVRPVAYSGTPGQALVGLAHRENDLLVVGADRPRWYRRPVDSVGYYCCTRARCPVLVVQPHEWARDIASRRWWRRSHFSDLNSGSSARGLLVR